MNTFEEKFFSTLDRLSEHFGPLMVWFDVLLERFFPQATAHAGSSCPPYYQWQCGGECYECTPDAVGTLWYCGAWPDCVDVVTVLDCTTC